MIEPFLIGGLSMAALAVVLCLWKVIAGKQGGIPSAATPANGGGVDD